MNTGAPSGHLLSALRESEAKLTAELADMKRLQQISSQLIQEDNIHALYEQILNAAIAVMGSDMGSMQMLYREKNELKLLAWKGFDPASATFWEWVRLDSGSTCGKAFATASRVIVPDVEVCRFMEGTEDLKFSRLSGIRAVQSTPLVSRNGHVVGMISSHWYNIHYPSERDLRLLDVLARQAADLIERKQAEDTLRESEVRFRTLISKSADMIVVCDSKGRVIYSSPAAGRILGYSPNELMMRPLFDLIHPEDRLLRERALQELVSIPDTGLDIQHRIRHKDGTWRWVEGVFTNLLHDPAIAGIVGNLRDITEHKALEQQKDEFMAIASHELKTPLTSIRAYGEMLLQIFKEEGNSQGVGFMQRLSAQVDRLTVLIRDLLDTTKISEGQLALQREPFNLNKLIAEHVEDLQHTSQKHRIIFKPGDISLVTADRERIGQVLDNLISNAIRYSPDGGKVTIVSAAVKDCIEVHIRDSGIGISPEFQQKVFDRFFRVSNPRMNTFPGMGLGLYISAGIIHRHGGAISVESRLNEGSVFYFTLPSNNPIDNSS